MKATIHFQCFELIQKSLIIADSNGSNYEHCSTSWCFSSLSDN
jgi:hypothetical protein